MEVDHGLVGPGAFFNLYFLLSSGMTEARRFEDGVSTSESFDSLKRVQQDFRKLFNFHEQTAYVSPAALLQQVQQKLDMVPNLCQADKDARIKRIPADSWERLFQYVLKVFSAYPKKG